MDLKLAILECKIYKLWSTTKQYTYHTLRMITLERTVGNYYLLFPCLAVKMFFWRNRMEEHRLRVEEFSCLPRKKPFAHSAVPSPNACVEKSHLKHPLALLKLVQMTRGGASQQAFHPQIYGAFFEQQIMTSLSECERRRASERGAGENSLAVLYPAKVYDSILGERGKKWCMNILSH